MEVISQTRYTQPCMVAFAAAVTRLLREEGLRPDYAAGLSLGEYSALCCAGVLDPRTAVELAAFRGRAMEEAAAGRSTGMTALLGVTPETAEECPIHQNYKEAVLAASDTDTIVTGRIGGTPVRILKNKMAREYVQKEKAGADRMELEKYTLGSLRRAVFEGDTQTGSLMAGQVAGQLHEIRPVAEIFRTLWEEYRAEKARVSQFPD